MFTSVFDEFCDQLFVLFTQMFGLGFVITVAVYLIVNDAFHIASLDQNTNIQQTGIDVPDYWPDLDGDMTKVIWSHATNSESKLNEALQGPTMMIEADVSLGHLEGHESEEAIPIMAHPPLTTSDLSLKMFLEEIVQAVSTSSLKKGIKLDFKGIDFVEASLKIVQEHQDKINFPLWLNADILEGPQSANVTPRTPVDADQFLPLCSKYFPDASLSPGFTTGYPEDPDKRHYTKEQVTAMAEVLRRNQSIGKKITFPVRAAFVANSMENLGWLLDETSTSSVKTTLTLWGTDPMTEDEKTILRESVYLIGKDRVYWDVGFPFQES